MKAEPPLIRPGQWIAATFGLSTFSPDEDLAEQLREAYTGDDRCQEALRNIRSGVESDFSVSEDDTLLYRDLIYVPDDKHIRLRLMAEHHDEPTVRVATIGRHLMRARAEGCILL